MVVVLRGWNVGGARWNGSGSICCLQVRLEGITVRLWNHGYMVHTLTEKMKIKFSTAFHRYAREESKGQTGMKSTGPRIKKRK